ncbi:MAG: cupin domain-containing protein [Bacteroidetes bacterium]|nr:cupin domain-containing protein [Bacteroidota bacterium]
MSKNIYKISKSFPHDAEVFENILYRDDIVIEKIISSGQKTHDKKWLQQDKDEWVILLQGSAELSFESGESMTLKSGDYIFIPSNLKHRVERTSAEPVSIWLAVHMKTEKTEM